MVAGPHPAELDANEPYASDRTSPEFVPKLEVTKVLEETWAALGHSRDKLLVLGRLCDGSHRLHVISLCPAGASALRLALPLA